MIAWQRPRDCGTFVGHQVSSILLGFFHSIPGEPFGMEEVRRVWSVMWGDERKDRRLPGRRGVQHEPFEGKMHLDPEAEELKRYLTVRDGRHPPTAYGCNLGTPSGGEETLRGMQFNDCVAGFHNRDFWLH